MGGKRGKGKGRGRTEEALAKAAANERALLRAEREAEGRLNEARAELAKAEARLQRRLTAVREAEAALASCQAARAVGPVTGPLSMDEIVWPEGSVPPVADEGPVLETPPASNEPAREGGTTARPSSRRRSSKAPVSEPASAESVAAPVAPPAPRRRARKTATNAG
jgi:hypothetical protein